MMHVAKFDYSLYITECSRCEHIDRKEPLTIPMPKCKQPKGPENIKFKAGGFGW